MQVRMNKSANDKAWQRNKQSPLQGQKEGPGIHMGPLVLSLSVLPPSVQCLWNSKDTA